jgi:MFS family permease
VLSAYRPLFSIPGAWAFMAGGLFARVGGAMFGVSMVVMIAARRDSYSLAGAITAVALVVLAIAGPVIGRLIDKHGQRRVAVPFVLSAGSCGLATVALSFAGAPAWTLFVSYGASAILPELGPMSRARWVHIYSDDPDALHTALSFEQIVDEASFVIGPVLGVVLSTVWFPEAGLLVAEVAYTVGILAFLAARETEPPVVPHAERPKGLATARPGVFVVAAVLTMTGVIFGANEVTAVAVADAAGQQGFSSVILGLFAVGSTLAGVAYGARTFRMPLARRLVIAAAGMFVLEVPALVVTDLRGLAVVMFVAGSATAPMLITAMTLSQKLVPLGLVTEAIAVATTGILIGISIGAAVGGWAVENLGAQQSYVVPVVAGLVAVVLAGIRLTRLEAAERAADEPGAAPAAA